VTQQQWRGQPQWGQAGGQWRQGGQWNQPGLGRSNFNQPPFVRAPQGLGFHAPQLGQPHYAPSQFSPPPVRRRNPLRALLLALIVLTVLAVIGLGATNLASPARTVAFQNDDYTVPPPDKNPPPIPVPDTYAQAETFVSRNPFYEQSAPIPVRCNAQPINVTTADDAQLKSHFESLMECTLRVWEPPLEKAGFKIVRPTVTIYGKDVTTKCGKSGVNAFYCSGDQQVYFSDQLPSAVPIVKQDKWAADVVMAHEFGHALQARSGILVSAHALGQNSNSQSTELEMSRRLETQADCFSGMFTRAVSISLGIQQSDLAGIQGTFVAVGDDTLTQDPQVVGNHGLARSRKYWADIGLGTSDVGKCNTFTVGKALVR
jgi:predicted metalloprotease